MANCDRRCPVFRQIESIRAKCLDCTTGKEDALFSKNKNTMQCGGRGVVYMDSAEDPETVICHSIDRRSTAPEVYAEDKGERNVTALPAEVEAKLRELTSTFFGLNQIEVNLLWHLANGGNLANFADTMDGFKADLARYKHFDKRNSWAILKRIGKAFAPFRALAGGLIGKGKGGAKQRISKFKQGDLFNAG